MSAPFVGDIQWATLATHHLFRARIFFDENAGIKHSLWKFTYWHYICLMKSKKCRNHSCESFCNVKGNFDKNTRATWASKFSICVLCEELSMVIVVTEKHQKQLFYSSKTPFFVVEVSNTVTFLKKCLFWRHINVSYNNQTGFSSQIVLLWVTC